MAFYGVPWFSQPLPALPAGASRLPRRLEVVEPYLQEHQHAQPLNEMAGAALAFAVQRFTGITKPAALEQDIMGGFLMSLEHRVKKGNGLKQEATQPFSISA